MTGRRTEGSLLLTEMPRAELEMLAADCPLEEIGAVFGLTRERVRQILVERGIHERRQSTLRAERRAEIRRLAVDHTAAEVHRLTRAKHDEIRAVADCQPYRGVWTPENIIDAIRDWVDRYGDTPGAQDWNPAMAVANGRPDIAERFYEDGCWPYTTSVLERFGSWNAAINAAGFEPRPPGVKRADVAKRPLRVVA